jgi:hypothetical protein
VPVYFPSEEKVPEGKRHLRLRTDLYESVELDFSGKASVGCDQFLYWNPTDPKRCLAPDLFVRLGEPIKLFETWKTWEHGAPHVAVEILSRSDRPDEPWEKKFERYRHVGVLELVRFDWRNQHEPLAVWDSIDSDLVERVLDTPRTAESGPLGLFWVVVDDAELGPALRLSRDPAGQDLLPTPRELARLHQELREQAERQRDEAIAARRALERKLDGSKKR